MKGFQSYLQADAYSGYDGIYLDSRGTIHEVACWAHARRKVRDAKASDSVIAAEAAARIRLLYDEEDACTKELQAMKLDPASSEWSLYRQRWRQERSVPLLVELDATLPKLLPKSEMAKALRYIHNQWDALCRYTENGWTTIDNNACEREYHQIDIGRRNWLFFGSHDGGRTAATLFSLIRTCVRLGIEPSAYLCDLYAELPRIRDTRPVTSPEPIDHEPYAPFLPDAWKSARSL